MATHDSHGTHGTHGAHVTSGSHGTSGAHAAHAHHRHGTDKGAAFAGLIAGAAVLFAIMFTIVKLTNVKYSHHEGARPGAQAESTH